MAVTMQAQDSEVRVNQAGNSAYPNEPSVAFQRDHLENVVVCANIDHHYFSSDSGKSWESGHIQTSHGMYGDPVLHATPNGKIFLCHLSNTKDKDRKNYEFIDRIVVQRSDDGGQSFNNGSAVGLNGNKMQDKPWMSSHDANGQTHLYLTWTEFDKMNSKRKKDHSRIRFSTSANDGDDWTDAITISDDVGDCIDDDHTLEGATTAVDQHGVIYCVWAGHYKLYFDKSTDGGKTWGTDRVIGSQQSGWVIDIPHVYRCNGMPFLLCDNSNGPHRGRLFVIYGDELYGDADVFVIYSDDQGDHWTEPIRVNQDALGNGKSQYLPNAAIDQSDGTLAVVYYDRRHSEHDLFSDVYLSVLRPGDTVFQEAKLNQVISDPYGKTTFSGDYIDLDFHAGHLVAVWNGSADGTSRLYSNKIKLADFKPIADQTWDSLQIASSIISNGKRQSLFIRSTQPLDLNYNYQYTRFFGLVRSTSEINDHIPFAPSGKRCVEHRIDFPHARRYDVSIRFSREGQTLLQVSSSSRWH